MTFWAQNQASWINWRWQTKGRSPKMWSQVESILFWSNCISKLNHRRSRQFKIIHWRLWMQRGLPLWMKWKKCWIERQPMSETRLNSMCESSLAWSSRFESKALKAWLTTELETRSSSRRKKQSKKSCKRDSKRSMMSKYTAFKERLTTWSRKIRIWKISLPNYKIRWRVTRSKPCSMISKEKSTTSLRRNSVRNHLHYSKSSMSRFSKLHTVRSNHLLYPIKRRKQKRKKPKTQMIIRIRERKSQVNLKLIEKARKEEKEFQTKISTVLSSSQPSWQKRYLLEEVVQFRWIWVWRVRQPLQSWSCRGKIQCL